MTDQKDFVLFSCLGTSDPVRGNHDGGMLHIVRHYKPNKILLFITREIAEFDKKDHRFTKAIEFIKKQYPGYQPEILDPCYDKSDDVSDFDAFYEPFTAIFNDLKAKYPESEILLNLSSGTPQMKMTMALLGSEPEFNTRCIQVKNPERCASTTLRTNSFEYNVDKELQNNEDNCIDAPNRCVEPRLFIMHKEKISGCLNKN